MERIERNGLKMVQACGKNGRKGIVQMWKVTGEEGDYKKDGGMK